MHAEEFREKCANLCNIILNAFFKRQIGRWIEEWIDGYLCDKTSLLQCYVTG